MTSLPFILGITGQKEKFLFGLIVSWSGIKFSAASEEEENFSYVGFQVTQTPSGILLHQLPYIAGLDASTWSSDALNDKQRDLTTKEQTEFRALVGSLNWCVQGTRPDLVFEQMV